MDRFKPVKVRQDDPNSEYALLDKLTGSFYLIGQGFGVIDRVADALNFGNKGQVGEIIELANSLRRQMKLTAP